MDNLPRDITDNILSRLPIEFKLQRKRVCSTWRDIIGKSKTGFLFVYANLDNNRPRGSRMEVQLCYGDQYEAGLEKSYGNKTLEKLDRINYNYVGSDNIVGSCNGLVLLRWHDRNRNTICNPVTGEFLYLPGLTEPRIEGWEEVGFGYLPSTNEYKVVRINNVKSQRHVEVYTLGSQTGCRWKEVIPYRFYSSGIFANGAIHWVGERGREAQHVYQIIAYDLAHEKVKYVPLPPFDYSQGLDGLILMLLGVKLCAVHYRGRNQILEIWALQKRTTRILRPRVKRGESYDNNWSWSKDFSIQLEQVYDYKPFTITSNNLVLLWHKRKELYSYGNKC